MKSTLRLSCAVAAALCWAGCSGGDEGRKTVYTVSGKVTMSGGALPDAVVTFAPKDGQPVAMGRTNSSGEYKLTTYDANDGAAPGNFSITVTKYMATAPSAAAPAHSTDPGFVASVGHGGKGKKTKGEASSNLIPPEYSDPQKTTLTFEVKAENDQKFDIDIK